MSERLPPIPTPPSQLWRQLRLQYLPVVVFAAGMLLAVTIWTRWVAPPTLVGEVEAIRTEVRSAQAGTISGLDVDLFQPVKAGQVLGRVHTSPPKVLEASLAMLRAEIEFMRATREPVVQQQRAAIDYQQLQLNWMRQRVELASLQGQLLQAETTLARVSKLRQTQMVPEEQYDLAKHTRDRLAAEVKSQAEVIAQLEPSMRDMEREAMVVAAPPAQALQAAITHKDAELRVLEAQLSPLPLVAPIDGVVTVVFRRDGEAVGTAEPILQISATDSKRIIGFLREPLQLEPKPGMPVEVRTRRFQRQIGTATVAQVSHQLEPITPTLMAAMRLPVSAVPTDYGVRVHVSMPAGLALRPGEHVDLIIRD